MSAGREALVLPLLFLTVALLGGLRIDEGVRLVPPPLASLVLALLLTGSLVRAGVLVPTLLVGGSRPPLSNASGATVLLTLFAATAQVFHLVTPERGLLHLIFVTFFFVQALTTLAGESRRAGLLRSLGVLLGAAFVLRWMVLETLYAPGTGMLKRVVTALAEGVTLGALEYTPHHAATGYSAFATLVLYGVGLVLLPRGGAQTALVPVPRVTTLVPALLLAAVGATGCGPASAGAGPEPDDRSAAVREDALRRARVWIPPAVPVERADLARNPPEGPQPQDVVRCTFTPEPVGGTTPKFYCRLPNGDVVKVKYGSANPELHGEVATTRLLAALGFPADRMYVVAAVECAGCPRFPYYALKCHERLRMRACLGGASPERTVRFPHAVIERRAAGERIEAVPDQGWAWYELSRVDAALGGATAAELDALRLLAAFLVHWDNKAANQRLICPPGRTQPDGRCEAPVALLQDVGATFGPLKADLRNWRETPVFADPASCTVSMKRLPWAGGTFPDQRISEPGRQLLLGLLERLRDEQLADLFTASGMAGGAHVLAEARDPRRWVAAFRGRVAQIRAAGPCPALSAAR